MLINFTPVHDLATWLRRKLHVRDWLVSAGYAPPCGQPACDDATRESSPRFGLFVAAVCLLVVGATGLSMLDGAVAARPTLEVAASRWT